MERDSALYAALYRLVAVQEDTLMMPVDSVEARALRDSLKAGKDSLKAETPADTVLKAVKAVKVPKEKPFLERDLIRPHREREIIEIDDVEEEAIQE